MSGFFEELRRRKVYRAAAAYVVVAAGIIQLASAVFPAWEMPAWALRLVIILVLIGFPIALILAWALEVTPEGIHSTPVSITTPRRKRNMLALVAVGIVVSVAAGFFLLPRASARKIDKSIAVLPFENFSDDKETAYFADGIQDDILTNLAKVGDLKVISRTSVMPYRGKDKNVREIGKALGVSAILEGSVRKAGNRVRVNVQLINAVNDEHMWAEDYDRDLTDVFAIQTDLAQKVARELQAKLSPAEKAQMTRKPTENTEAYLAFVEAHTLHAHLEEIDQLKKAEKLYDRALQLDPNFALAAAEFSRLESWLYHTYDPLTARKEKARSLAERALALQSDLPEGHLALGFSYYYGDRNYERAMQEFQEAERGFPNNSDVHLAMGAIQRRQGKWAESNANLAKAAELSPNETWPLQNLAINYGAQRDFKAARETIDRALKLAPESLTLWSMKAQLEFAEDGTFNVADRAAEYMASHQIPGTKRAWLECALAQTLLLERRYTEALQKAERVDDAALEDEPDGFTMKYGVIGIARTMLHDDAGAKEALLKAKERVEKEVREAPDDFKRHSKLALILAWLGEKDAAVAEAKRATELLPESVDAFDGPSATETLAEVYAAVGESDKAIDLLEGLLARPSPVTPALLRMSPVWDSLRTHPRFIELLKKSGGSS